MKWTIHKAATEFGVSRETIERGRIRAGAEKANSYEISALVKFAFGDLKAERTRFERARADEKEKENLVADGLLHDRAEIMRAVWQNWMLPWRTMAELMPNQLAALLNPSNPEHARKILDEWVEVAKKTVLKQNGQ